MELITSTNDIFALIINSGLVVKSVLIILLLLSAVSWAIIATKWRLIVKARRESKNFLDLFWKGRRLDDIYEKSKGFKNSSVSSVFRAGYIELVNLKSSPKKKKDETKDVSRLTTADVGEIENIERALKRQEGEELTNLERMVPFLATTGSTAPFIGLFGTVWGIMDSFIHIGMTKDTSLAVVAPGISEALVATAFGLFAAIPAVIFYNFFVSKIRVLGNSMDTFSKDFLNIDKRHFYQ